MPNNDRRRRSETIVRDLHRLRSVRNARRRDTQRRQRENEQHNQRKLEHLTLRPKNWPKNAPTPLNVPGAGDLPAVQLREPSRGYCSLVAENDAISGAFAGLVGSLRSTVPMIVAACAPPTLH